jgi:hypothetical protein
MEQVVAWIGQDAPEPDTVASARFHENRLLTLSTRVSAAYKGLYALIMKSGSVDWLYHQGIDFATVNDLKIDVHHIFPRAWCAKRKINRRQYDCIVNKTAISLDANRFITDNGPSVYLPMLESRAKIDTGKMDEIVATHQIAGDRWLLVSLGSQVKRGSTFDRHRACVGGLGNRDFLSAAGARRRGRHHRIRRHRLGPRSEGGDSIVA